MRALPATLFVLLIQGYQRVVSPWTAPSCRYYPSCSQYAIEALKTHGLLHGGWLAARRLGRCHPWTTGGVDHVPPRAATTRSASTSTRTSTSRSSGSAPSTLTGV